MAKKKEPKLNTKLIRKVIHHILEEPKRYYQASVIEVGLPGDSIFPCSTQTFAKCGAAACIGGWAYMLLVKRPNMSADGDQLFKAEELLGLTRNQAQILFTGRPEVAWPKKYGTRWGKANGDQKKEAKIAAGFLEEVIKTKGKILEDSYLALYPREEKEYVA